VQFKQPVATAKAYEPKAQLPHEIDQCISARDELTQPTEPVVDWASSGNYRQYRPCKRTILKKTGRCPRGKLVQLNEAAEEQLPATSSLDKWRTRSSCFE
jgi:hypothetical protein